MDRVFPNAEAAVADIPDGASIAFGGFFTCGNPIVLTEALAKQGANNLTIIAMCLGVGNWELNLLINNHQVKKGICNYPFARSVSKESPFEKQLRDGEVTAELYPMGTFIEKLRAGGAGIGAFYTPTGVGTYVSEGKEVRIIEGREYLLEFALTVDFAFIHAWKSDTLGNLVFRKTAQNYNPEMAKAARVTIVETENLVQPGELDPDFIHLPGIYVNRIVKIDRPVINIGIDGADETPASLNAELKEE